LAGCPSKRLKAGQVVKLASSAHEQEGNTAAAPELGALLGDVEAQPAEYIFLGAGACRTPSNGPRQSTRVPGELSDDECRAACSSDDDCTAYQSNTRGRCDIFKALMDHVKKNSKVSCWAKAIKEAQTLPGYHVAPPGSNGCDFGVSPTEEDCMAAAVSLYTIHAPSEFEVVDQDDEWWHVPCGCSVHFLWTVLYSEASNCATGDGEAVRLICTGSGSVKLASSALEQGRETAGSRTAEEQQQEKQEQEEEGGAEDDDDEDEEGDTEDQDEERYVQAGPH